MFHYAVGRALAHRLGTELKLDISSFQTERKRRYELDRFKITAALASPEDIRALTGILGTRNGRVAKSVRGVCRRLGFVGRLVTGPAVWEKSFDFDPEILALKDGVYLHGKFQSEKYFSGIAGILRDEFQLRSSEEEDQNLARCMKEHESSVSIHIRRGDYVTEPRQWHHAVLPIEYYQEAVRYMRAQLGGPSFFIFSDDPLWVQDNLDIQDASIVSLNGPDRGPRELLLMSKCRHHIIANSTFSWWGAWLSNPGDGITCAPKQWFAPEKERLLSMQDILPPAWKAL